MSGFDSARFTDEPSNVGPATLEELRVETARIAGMFANAPRMEVFFRTKQHRNRIFALLDGRQRVAETRDLYFLAGATLGMLAEICEDLGYPDTGMSHARAALLCARESGHDGLVAWVRCQQAMMAYLAGRPTPRRRVRPHRAGQQPDVRICRRATVRTGGPGYGRPGRREDGSGSTGAGR